MKHQLLNAEQAAERFHLTKEDLVQAVQEGKVKALQVGNSQFFRLGELELYTRRLRGSATIMSKSQERPEKKRPTGGPSA